ncbi:MAG TPA: DUF2273 domain-containing protein [Eubacteriales bacterium]|nr:DUF2273 domain-containing protein [Eubacteriales bacterium]
MEDGFEAFLQKHKFTILFVLIGLILMILFFTIGFWKTILLALILVLCFFVGYLLDRGGPEGFRAFFGQLFKKKEK